MALGRALRKVLIIDDGKPCNMQTPHSHNLITQDGEKPAVIAAKARKQVEAYDTIEFFPGLAVSANRVDAAFVVQTDSGAAFSARKLIFATGIRDVMPDVPGFSDCWGISALHCPYCHGYEVRGEQTGVLGNGDAGFEFVSLIANWTKHLTLFTNGESTLTEEQTKKLEAHCINVVEEEIGQLEHTEGRLRAVVLKDGMSIPMTALYARLPFQQHCRIPEQLGCELTEEGYVKVSPAPKTSVPGVFACGDNASSMRTLANAVGTGTAAGMVANRELALEDF
jgi:thioredoxin reductase